MSNRDILALCAGNLLRRKTRTVLAVIGVIVGVCAIVVMVSIGVALNVGFQDMIAGYGDLHSIQVYNYGSSSGSGGKTNKLDDSTINKIAKIDGVTAITPQIETYLTIGIGSMKTTATVVGVDPEYVAKMSYDLESGRSFTAADSDSNVLLFGYNIACWFYNPRTSQSYDWSNTEPTVNVVSNDVILTGDYEWGTNNEGSGEVKYESFEAQGVGLLSGLDSENSYRVFMPIKALQKIMDANTKAEGGQVTASSQKTYDQVVIYAEDIDKVSDICSTIKEDYGFQTYSLNDMLKELQSTANLIEMVLGGIGAVSLLVAAIGIANTMIMSVYERTREIGVMKVIGASLGDIQKMFLMEAGMIGFGGGLIGVGLSYLISLIINTVGAGLMASLIGTGETARASVIPFWLSLGALAFATLVGVVSGWLPAKRAMNLSALEGLKNE